MMDRHTFQDGCQSSRLDGAMSRDDLVMFASLLGRNPKMLAFLTGDFITKHTQGFGEIDPVDIARQLHTAINSSRTK